MSNQRANVLDMWVIYHKPADLPQHEYVVRRFIIGSPTLVAKHFDAAATLDLAREFVPPHLCRIDRFPDDDPCIVEVWL